MSKKRLSTGQKVESVSEEWMARMGKYLYPLEHGVIRIMPNGWMYPGLGPTFIDKMQSVQFRSDDVIILAFPKCGNTWMQETLWTMLHNPDLDNPQAGEAIWERSLDISFDMFIDPETSRKIKLNSILEAFKLMCPGKKEEDGMLIQILDMQPGPRVINSHFPLELMPPDLLEKTKILYLLRNPKDMAVSYYNMLLYQKMLTYSGPFDEFVKAIMKDEMFYCPYWLHVQQAWQKRNHPNLQFVFYEDLKADFMLELQKLNDFLGTNLTQQQMKNVAQHTTFSSMKSRGQPFKDTGINHEDVMQKGGGFFRKGVVGDWKNYFSPELNLEMDKWIKDNIGDIPFKWGD